MPFRIGSQPSHTSWVRALSLAVVLVAAGAALPAIADQITVKDVSVVAGDDTEVVMDLDKTADGNVVSSFAMSNPDRVVIDIADAVVASGLADAPPAGMVKSIEASSWDDGQGMMSRITLTLTGPADHVVKSDGDRVVAVLTPKASGDDPIAAALGDDSVQDDPMADRLASAIATPAAAPASAAPPASPVPVQTGRALSGPDNVADSVALSSLDFQNLDSTSRVIIGLKGTTRYQASQPQKNLIVVDVPGAFLPQSLQRVLDASEFLSPVRMVRAYRTSSGARVAISLRQATSYTAQIVDGRLYVDVAIPAGFQRDREVATQSWAAVSPATNDDGIKSAYGQEIMIGSAGHTVNPQSAFGSGSGATDPSSMLGMASGFAYDSSTAASAPYTGRRISLDFVNADIHSIFRLISHVSRLNIVAGDDVKGKVTVRLVDVPWDQALAAILQAKGLGSQRFGNILRVAPIETIKSEQQSALEAKRAKEELVDLDLLVIPLNYSKVGELEEKVAALLSPRGSVQVDESSNQLIIKESQDRLAQVRELIRHLDKQTPQVLIEARIVEANSSYSRALGVQWGTVLDATTNTGYSTGLFFPNGIGMMGDAAGTMYSADASSSEALLVDLGADSSNSGIAIHLGSIPGLFDLDARLSAMESDGWGKVVSSPRVTTLDNKTATISQGARVPYLSTSSGGTNVQFVEAVLELEVTPHITSDDKVFLSVRVQNDRPDYSNLVQGQPAIAKKEATTELLVADGDTTVLGGVYSTEESFSQGRVPFFSKIPLLGYLFKNSAEKVTRNELLVFITPHVVSRPVTDTQ